MTDRKKLSITRRYGRVDVEPVGINALLIDMQKQIGDVLLGIATPATNPYGADPCETDPEVYEGFITTVYYLADENGTYSCFKDSDGNPLFLENEVCLFKKPFKEGWEKILLDIKSMGRGVKFFQDTKPSAEEAVIGDYWLRTTDMKGFRLTELHETKYWIETTSPPIGVDQLENPNIKALKIASIS